jgi:hypothetical protein
LILWWEGFLRFCLQFFLQYCKKAFILEILAGETFRSPKTVRKAEVTPSLYMHRRLKYCFAEFFLPFSGVGGETVRRNVLFGLILGLLLVGSLGLVAAAVLFTLNKPASVYVAMSDGEIQLYSDQACSLAIDQIGFGSMVQGMSKNCSVMYLKNLGVSSVAITWSAPDLPSAFIMKGYFGVGGSTTQWAEWANGITLQPNTVCPVKFQLSIIGVTMLVGQTYSWTMRLQSSN